MLDYYLGAKMYCREGKYRKVRRDMYVKDFPEEQVVRAYKVDKTAGRKQALWVFTECVVIHINKFVIKELFSPYTMEKCFGLRWISSGRYAPPDNKYWNWGVHKAQGALPLTLSEIGIVVSPKTLKRKLDPTKRKELNDLVAHVRNILRPRIKLGAFDSVKTGPWATLTPEEIIETLRAVDPSDIKTMYPVLRHAYAYCYGKRDDLLGAFNRMIEGYKERLRKHLNIVSYE